MVAGPSAEDRRRIRGLPGVLQENGGVSLSKLSTCLKNMSRKLEMIDMKGPNVGGPGLGQGYV